ncbi:MAG: hypothetical protein ACI9XP_000132 [Lentimonas sp.]|jgi:hypothetical protein
MTKLFLSVMALLTSFCSLSQITGSELKGEIRDDKQGTVPGVQVQVIHEPTGTLTNLRTDVNGRYFLPNLKPGGPYTVKFKYQSYIEREEKEIYLVLGESKVLDLNIEPVINELEEVTIEYDKNDEFSDKRKGAQTNIGEDQIGRLPTLNRSLQDMTRVSPQTSGNSYVGSNYRYNNLSIDGVANNDAFGFQEPGVGAGGSTAAGSPGALSQTQPISLDAVGEIQIATSPYDVKLGNFTGGSLNVVTRSGTNRVEGSIYNFFKSNGTTGRSPYEAREKIESFYDIQSGFRVGGAIKKNKLFYFVNAEIGRRESPLLFEPGAEGSIFEQSDIQALYDTVSSRYNYDAGSFGKRNLATSNNKFFLRFDYYLNEKHQLIFRHNMVQAAHENLSRSGTIFNYGSQGFTHNSLTNSTVFEVKSRLGAKLFNNLIVGHSRIHDFREPFSELFPHIEITYKSAGQIFLGSYREASVFQMKQNSYELSDNLTYYLDKHKLTFGTHNELYDFDYHFVTPYTGRWEYKSIQDFYDSKPSRVRGTYNLENDDYDYNYNRPSADFSVLMSSVYIQDDHSITKKLKMTYGLRMEGNIFLNDQGYSEKLVDSDRFNQYATGITSKFIVSPRFGFNYDVLGNNRWKLRGGSGIFAGRMPFAWSAYSYIYNGAQFGSIDVKPSGQQVDLITDDYNQLATLQAGKKEINMVDPSYRLPRVLRSSLATDIKLPKDYVLTLEGIYTKTIYDIYFKTINLKDSSVRLENSGNDDRKIFLGSGDEQRYDADYANVFLLTNTNKGYRYSLSASLSKKFKNNLSIMAAYTYGMSKDIMNGVRVSPQANWNWNQTVDPNDPQLSYSNFDIRNRVVSSVEYEKIWSKRHKTVFSAFFLTSSGNPFTYVYNGDLNRDNSSKNDLIYVPQSPSEINLVDYTNSAGVVVTAAEQWAQLNEYITDDKYLSSRRGQYTERNGGRTPWNTQIDLHVGQEYTYKGKKKDHQFMLTADVFNFTNLLNYRWGRQYFVPNTTNAGYSLIDAKSSSDGKTVEYKFEKPEVDPYQIDGIASRLQMQMGLRYSF